MTDESAELDVSEFYDRLSGAYDEMTGFEKRFVKESPFFRLIVRKHSIQSALDAGCGTGFHALLLSQLGVRVWAADVSREMLARLESHSRAMHLDVHPLASPLEELERNCKGPFDAVFCLGNTLSHLQGEKELHKVLENFHSIIRPQGVLYLQLLNFEHILASGQRVQSARRYGASTYVRFYDFPENSRALRFNILTLHDTDAGIQSDLLSIRLNPFSRAEIHQALESAGFAEPCDFGSIALDPYKAEISNDLVIEALRP
ncbi:MAG TPA: class I SAM-dependent methyltransferase [Bacteroidota bacterium]|nr:class I SAM-dependent methyltransferase [Bacteroidota bacterium]